MKLLLDECLPRRLKRTLLGHEIFTVDDAGLKGLKNGELLQAASGQFQVLITVDRNIPAQQNLAVLQIALMIMRAKTNRFEHLEPLIPQALATLETIQPGTIVVIESSAELSS